jgi:hypothetical protein
VDLTISVPDDLVERRAALVAQRLRDTVACPATELLDSAALAERLGRSREWVYDHADELGAVRLGSRSTFEWPTCWERLKSARAEKDRCGSERSRSAEDPGRTDRPSPRAGDRAGTRVPLLPVKGLETDR